jgi:5-methylcytosine-specific restriction enzyme subunit McrC
MKNKVVQFFEYDRVKFNSIHPLANSEAEIKFTESQISALRKYHTVSNGLYYDLIDNGICFKEHVGVIQINDLTIEVLPKIDKEDNDFGKWHDILLYMLNECRFLEPRSTGYAYLKLQSNSILRLYFEKYIKELESLIRQGLTKKYRDQESNQTALKGKLLFSQHIQHNVVRAERFYVNHTVFDYNHYIHQILLQALEVIHQLSENTILSDRIDTLLLLWPRGKSIKVNEKLFKTIPINRKTQPYQEALLIARMILLNYHPDLRAGNQSILALMFNMNALWEEFIFKRLKSKEQTLNWKVTAQKGLKYWDSDSGSKKLIPDIIIEFLDTGERMVLDTKWKRPALNKPDDHDLRQLLSYKLYYEGDNAYLLYPCSDVKSKLIKGKYLNKVYSGRNTVFREGFGLNGGLMFINILNGRQLISKSSFIDTIKNLLVDYTYV